MLVICRQEAVMEAVAIGGLMVVIYGFYDTFKGGF